MQLLDILIGTTSGSGSCTPDWAAEDKPCPHGHSLGLPLSKFTFPTENPTFLTYIAAGYASAPFFLAIGFPVLFLWTRGTKEILGTLYFWLTAVLMVVLKSIIGGPRPAGSCQTSCGMPSGHTMESMAFFTWFLLEVVQSKLTSLRNKSLWLLLAGVLLLPVGWSRTVTLDHSWVQVIVGGAIGVFLGLGWFLLLQQRCAYWVLKFLWLHLPFLRRNYPPDGVSEESPWAAGGSGVPDAASAVGSGRSTPSKRIYGSTSDRFPGSG